MVQKLKVVLYKLPHELSLRGLPRNLSGREGIKKVRCPLAGRLREHLGGEPRMIIADVVEV
jgi:hypothetical protein